MTDDVVRWGIAGTGWISRTVVPDLRLTGNAEVVAVSSRDDERARAFARELGIPTAYATFGALLEDASVDAVYLGTPIGVHLAMASAAIDAGKHVLVEKAITTTADDARELARRAEARGVFLMEGMWMKFSPNIAALTATLATGAIGDVRHVQSGFGFAVPRDPGNRYWSAAQGGGALLDMGVYCLTLSSMLMGAPDDVVVVGSIEPDGVDTRVLATLRSGAVTAQLTTSIEHQVEPSATVNGSRGFIRLARPFWMSSSFEVFPEGARPGGAAPYMVEADIEGTGFVPMFRAAGDDILAGRQQNAVHPMADAIATLELIDRLRADLLRGGTAG